MKELRQATKMGNEWEANLLLMYLY